MKWAVVSQQPPPATIMATLNRPPRTAQHCVVRFPIAAVWNAVVFDAYLSRVAAVLLLQPRVWISEQAMEALVEAAGRAPFVGIKGVYEVGDDGQCGYRTRSAGQAGEPMAAVQVLTFAALDRVAGTPYASRREPREVWMTRRLARYGVRPLLLAEQPERVVVERVAVVKGRPVQLAAVLAAFSLEEQAAIRA